MQPLARTLRQFEGSENIFAVWSLIPSLLMTNNADKQVFLKYEVAGG